MQNTKKRVLVKFKNSAFNYMRTVGAHIEDSIIIQSTVNKITVCPKAPYPSQQNCIGVEINTFEQQTPTQDEFRAVYGAYITDLYQKTDYKIHAFCYDIMALSSWTSQIFNRSLGDYKRLDNEFVTDVFGMKQPVYIIDGNKFIAFNLDETKIFDDIKSVVRCKNNGEYGRSRPETKLGNSFYNSSGELIFYYNDEQYKNLDSILKEDQKDKIAWENFNAVKDKITHDNWVECQEVVAMHLLESVPPVRMKINEFLAGEAIAHHNGLPYYYHCKRQGEDSWLVKYSTVKMFENK